VRAFSQRVLGGENEFLAVGKVDARGPALAMPLVQQGRASDVLAYIDAVDAGVFA